MGVTFALEPGEGIVLDPVTGNYMLTYSEVLEDGSKVLTHGTFFPATKIAPDIKSKFHSDRTGAVIYSYSVSSGVQSRQILDIFRFDLFNKVVGSQDLPTNIQTATLEQVAAVFDANKLALTTPPGWDGFISTNESGASRITWDPIKSGTGIRPGESQQGFGFVSQNLPGVGAAQFKGIRDGRNGFSGEGPDPTSDISKQIQDLYKNDFVTSSAAVPTIAVPTPFDPAVTLERIQTHTHTWIGMQLLDPAFSAQLDRSFQSAISAYRLNQPKVGKKQIQTMRELIKKEHADADREDDNDDRGEQGDHDDKNKRALIDKLAARILDFDLKYVTKRMGGDKDD
ncbi:MAG: hypothetical protein A2143_12200 [Gallionellales bacterium RBG_16_57_15]|nr:MAG: hypothetical protein A2143_12200 [Gallionellales bacterium RBG_16_57_15]